MTPVFKTADKAAADAFQRQYYWNLTPQERLYRAQRLRERLRALYLANPANPPLPAPPDGKTVLKSDRPIQHGGPGDLERTDRPLAGGGPEGTILR